MKCFSCPFSRQHDIAEILLKVALNTINQIQSDVCLPSRYNKNIFLWKIKQVYLSTLKLILPIIEGVGVIVVYATFNNVTVIS